MPLIKVFLCEKNIYLRVGIHIVLSDLVAVHVAGFEEVVAAPYHPYQVRLDIQKYTH